MQSRMVYKTSYLHPQLGTTKTLLLVVLTLVIASPTMAAADSSSSADDDTVPSLSDMDTYDAFAIVFIVMGMIVSSAGGIGGGVIMVPAMVLIMGFDIKRATPISNVAILGGALANAWFNMHKRHPSADRPLIDADLALGMIPVVIGGTVLGALINKLLPSYIVSLLFVVVLAVSGTRMMIKGIRLYRAESVKKADADPKDSADAAVSPDAYTLAFTPNRSVGRDTCEAGRLSASVIAADALLLNEVEANKGLADILEQERHFAWKKHGAILVCYLGVVATSIGDASVTCGGVVYWVILLVEIPWVAVFVVLASHYLHKEYQHKATVAYPYIEGDIRWTRKAVIYFPLGCAFGGVVAGMFGVGGGVITGPIMIEMGIVPEVASSTMALMILYSSAAATAKYTVFNMIAWDWAAVLCAVTFAVTSAAQVVILGYVRRSGRQSIVVLCISAAVVIGTILMTYQAIKTTIDDAGKPFTADICS
ncbi:uncharacterized protein IUM83_07749 [Phytophthora cinnamomi]|uniref:uncharacterized protein n=1 Tax=Phytophthora cinnamomi TaxID=4785 RepID=UPI003559759F|nr:membrane protein [Phytophthora cinnamomi]